jgi:hypothetical protein
MVIDFDKAWASFLGVRKVTYTPYLADTDGHGAPVADVDAFPAGGPDKDTEGAGDAEVFHSRRTWHLRASTLGGTPVTERGLITDTDGSVWVLQRVQYQTFGTRVRCECVRR